MAPPASKKRPPNLRLGEVWRLYRDRNPDLSYFAARQMVEAEIGDPNRLTDVELGERVQLTLEERYWLKIKSIRSVRSSATGQRISRDEERRFYAERKKERDRDRQKLKRAEKAKARAAQAASVASALELDVREEMIFASLTHTFASTPSLLEALKGGACWRGPDGRPLSNESFARVFRRALDHLEDAGLIVTELRNGRRGAKVRWVKKADKRTRSASNR